MTENDYPKAIRQTDAIIPPRISSLVRSREEEKNDAIVWSRLGARAVFLRQWRRDCSVPEMGVWRRNRLGRPERLGRPKWTSLTERSIGIRRSVCTTPGGDQGPGGR